MPPERAVDLVLSGITGRMGRMLVELASGRRDVRIAGGIARRRLAHDAARVHGCERIERPDSAGDLIASADVIVDFSSPDALEEMLGAQADALEGKALLIGTTGLTDAIAWLLEQQARRTAVLAAANFSLGVNLLAGLVSRAARALPAARYDVEIVEAHHRGKADAPSGTALVLAQAIARARGIELSEHRRDGRSGRTGERPEGEIGVHAVRGGGVVGEHHVLFLGARERIDLAHTALDRSLFAEGALEAARWIAGRPPGRYRMNQVLGLDGED